LRLLINTVLRTAGSQRRIRGQDVWVRGVG